MLNPVSGLLYGIADRVSGWRSFYTRENSSVYVSIATQSCINARPTMEDFTQSADWDNDASHPMNGLRLLAVFDGHGRPEVAEWLSENVKTFVGGSARSVLKSAAVANDSVDPMVEQEMAKRNDGRLTPEQIGSVLTLAFLAMDRTLREVMTQRNWALQGATGVVVLVSDTHICSANVGDSRALLWRVDARSQQSCPQGNHSSLIELTQDHKPDDTEERRRIEQTDGFSVFTQEESGQVVSRIWPKGWKAPNLNLSRAFGDFHCKPQVDDPATNPITVQPFIKTVALDTVGQSLCDSTFQKTFVLVLASDGVVNERFGNQNLVTAVQHLLQANWATRVANKKSASECDGHNFMDTISSDDWMNFAASLLSTTEASNHGDNQSIHLARVTQRFYDLEQVEERGDVRNRKLQNRKLLVDKSLFANDSSAAIVPVILSAVSPVLAVA